MGQPQPLSSEMIRHGQSGLAGFAASLVLEKHPELENEPGQHALSSWNERLAGLLHELAVALEMGCPEIFVERVLWEESVFKARREPIRHLEWSLSVLAEVFAARLPEAARDPAVRLLRDAGAALETRGVTAATALDPARPSHLKILRFLRLALQGSTGEAVSWVLRLRDSGTPSEKIIGDILVPVQREIGQRWQAGEISIYEEQLVTRIVFRAIDALAPKGPTRARNGLTMVLACVEGNRHDMGTRILAQYMEQMGWKTVLLGPDLPAAELRAAVEHFRPSMVMLCATLSIHLPALKEAARAVREAMGDEALIIAGGGVLTGKKHLSQALGVDLIGDDLEEAMALATDRVGQAHR